jgi:hypothetical protein
MQVDSNLNRDSISPRTCHPDKMQRLRNHAVWDHQQAMGVVCGFVVEHLADPGAVLVIDESGQEKAGVATVGPPSGSSITDVVSVCADSRSLQHQH